MTTMTNPNKNKKTKTQTGRIRRKNIATFALLLLGAAAVFAAPNLNTNQIFAQNTGGGDNLRFIWRTTESQTEQRVGWVITSLSLIREKKTYLSFNVNRGFKRPCGLCP